MNGVHILKNDAIGIRINGLVKDALVKVAKEENTTLSALIEKLAIEELRRRKVKLVVKTELLAS